MEDMLKSVILEKDMKTVSFVKDDYKVIFPTNILNELYDVGQEAEKLRAEINVGFSVKDNIVQDVLYTPINKFIVVNTDLPFVVKANEPLYFFNTAGKLRYLREKSYNSIIIDADKKISQNIRIFNNTIDIIDSIDFNIAKINLQNLKEVMSQFETSFTYIDRNGKTQNVNPEVIDSLVPSEEKIKALLEDLQTMEAIGTEWIGQTELKDLSKIEKNADSNNEVGEQADYIFDIHTHPVDYPSPPSAIRDEEDESKIFGDIVYLFNESTEGNLLHRGKGKWELILYREKDKSNEEKYLKLFDDFWALEKYKDDVVGKSNEEIAAHICEREKEIADFMRSLALKPAFE